MERRLSKIKNKTKVKLAVKDIYPAVLVDSEEGDVLVITEDEKEAGKIAGQGNAVLLLQGETGGFVSNVPYVTFSLEDCDYEYFNKVFCRQKGYPLEIMRTERTVLDEIEPADLPELYEVYDDDEVRRFMEPLYEMKEEDEYTRQYIRNMYGMYDFGIWIVRDRITNEMIGRAGLSLREVDGETTPELGFVVARKFRRKGYAYEICEAILRYAFNELDFCKVNIVTAPDNYAAKSLAEKLSAKFYAKTEEYEIFTVER